MKFFACNLMLPVLLLVTGFPLHGQDTTVEADSKSAGENAALEKARALFPAFQQAMLTDEDAAQAAFEPFLTMPDEIQKRLQIWLDAQWTEKRQAYQRVVDRNNSGETSLSQDLKDKIKEGRETLNEIKAMSDEEKMKKELKSEGWPAMESLLLATKRSGRKSDDLRTANPKEAARLLDQALTVGNFRYAIRKNRGESATKPHEELGVADPDGEGSKVEISVSDSRKMDSENQSVLVKNEEMKSQVPRAEYEGILEVNQWRIAAGLNALLIDTKLCEAARDHSKDMADLGFFAHDSPVEGKKRPWDRAKKFGTTAHAENIAINSSPQGANQAWFHSPGHHKNMFSKRHTHMGLGIHGRHYTQLFR